jgi:predicted HTH domain antitoxin
MRILNQSSIAMGILITDQMLHQANLPEAQVRLELAIFLFEKDLFTLGKAAELAQVPQFILQKELARRQIPMHYDEAAYQQDLATLRRLNDEA